MPAGQWAGPWGRGLPKKALPSILEAQKVKFLELKDISERDMELVNPTSPAKVLEVGQVLGLHQGSRVIDFGCGYGEMLALWGEQFGIGGVGVELRETACERARRKMAERRLDERITIAGGNAAEYPFERHAFHVATCIGASFIWRGYRQTLRALREAIVPSGKIVVGEPYWLTDAVPPEFARQQTVHTEYDLLQIARQEGLDVEWVVRSNHDDWDRYESANWRGLLRWIEEHPEHPERGEVVAHLHESQDEYFRYGRQYLGWAMLVLNPRRD
jgi:SAM-dependent methyltransferase